MCGAQLASGLTPYAGAIATLVGVAFGFGLSRIPARRERKRKATGYLRGLDVEIRFAEKHARSYVEGEDGKRVLAPAYRLLTRFTIDATAWLAGEGFLTRGEVEAMLSHLAAAEQFNRCLAEVDQRANEFRRVRAERGLGDADIEYHTTEMLKGSTVVNRAEVKARNISTGDPARGTAHDAQKAVQAAAERTGLRLAD